MGAAGMTRFEEILGKTGDYWLEAPVSELDVLAERLQEAGRVAVLDAAGCLVSNLRVWENLILPAWYHRGGALADWEAPLSRLLDLAGLAQEESQRLLGSLPGMLTPDERRLLVLLRAAVLAPDYVLIESDWLAWLRRQAEDHPAARLWQVLDCVRLVLGARSPGDEFIAVRAEQL